MKSIRYVYVKLSNDSRQYKKQGNKYHKKSVHQEYLKSRNTMSWRLKQFAQKQGYQYLAGSNKNSILQVHPYIRSDYYQYQAKLVKYWGGWKYYKKMGRMDKVRYKQMQKEKDENKNSRKNNSRIADLLESWQVLHELDVKISKLILLDAFNKIRRMKKPIRNIQYTQQQPKKRY